MRLRKQLAGQGLDAGPETIAWHLRQHHQLSVSTATLRRFRQHADSDPLAAAWRLTLSGLTRADVLGLRWSDVDTDAGTVTVRQGRVAVQGGRESSTDAPKSAQRRRTVPVEVIHPGTMAALRALRVRQAQDRLRAGEAWHDTG